MQQPRRGSPKLRDESGDAQDKSATAHPIEGSSLPGREKSVTRGALVAVVPVAAHNPSSDTVEKTKFKSGHGSRFPSLQTSSFPLLPICIRSPPLDSRVPPPASPSLAHLTYTAAHRPSGRAWRSVAGNNAQYYREVDLMAEPRTLVSRPANMRAHQGQRA